MNSTGLSSLPSRRATRRLAGYAAGAMFKSPRLLGLVTDKEEIETVADLAVAHAEHSEPGDIDRAHLFWSFKYSAGPSSSLLLTTPIVSKAIPLRLECYFSVHA